jgi:DNA-binding transcriptional MerR regulator
LIAFHATFRPLFRWLGCWRTGIPSEARLTSASEICRHPKIGLTLEPIPGFMLNAEGEDRAIGELSRLAGISTDTLRHYEHLGVLPKPPRTNGGYRDYPANSLDRVRQVQSALRVGFTLPELATILKMRDRGDAPCHRVRAIAEHKLEQVKQQINDLIGMRNQVERILKDWEALLARTGSGKRRGYWKVCHMT